MAAGETDCRGEVTSLFLRRTQHPPCLLLVITSQFSLPAFPLPFSPSFFLKPLLISYCIPVNALVISISSHLFTRFLQLLLPISTKNVGNF